MRTNCEYTRPLTVVLTMTKPSMKNGAIVLYKPRQKRNKRKKLQNKRKPKQALVRKITRVPGMKINADVKRFEMAMMSPFNPNAIGCRVPDSFPMPTATYHVRASLSATTAADGTFKAFILPSPALTYISRPGAFGTLSGATGFSQNNTTSSTAAYLVTPTALSQVLTEYRTVAWGMRLIAKNTAFAAKGKLMIAAVPTTANAPSWNTLETVTATDSNVIAEYCCGVEFTASTWGSIFGIPGVQVFSAQDLLRHEIQCLGLPSGNDFHQFKGTADRSTIMWNTNQVLADEGVFNNTTGLVNATAGGRKDVASLRGGTAFVIAGAGFNATTNEFDIELIYHLEGLPNVAASGSALLIPSASRPLIGDTSLVERAVGFVRRAVPLIKTVATLVAGTGATRAVEFGTPMIAD